MNAAARTSTARTSTAHSSTARPRPRRSNKFDGPISDMADELLTRIIGGLGTVVSLERRDREVLYHYLFGRDGERVATELGLRETTVHRHLHRVFLATGTETRRELLELGRELAEGGKRVEVAPVMRRLAA